MTARTDGTQVHQTPVHFLPAVWGMRDIREFQKKVLEMASQVGGRTRYRLLEMHARLGRLRLEEEDPPAEPAAQPQRDAAKGVHVAA